MKDQLVQSQTTNIQCGLCGEEALRLTHARTGQTAYVCSSPDCPSCTEWFDEAESPNDASKATPPSQREMISLAHEQAEAGAAAIASGNYLAADIFLKLALDYLRDGCPELQGL